jgi:tight adherence protein C
MPEPLTERRWTFWNGFWDRRWRMSCTGWNGSAVARGRFAAAWTSSAAGGALISSAQNKSSAALVGIAISGLTVLGRGFSVVPVIGLVVLGTLLGVLGRDQVLSIQVRRREQRILAEFPAVAELLALAVAAGEGPVGALDRVARTCRGELAAELRRTLADARTGMSLIEALTGLANRTTLPSLARFVDGIAVAMDRGTPLAEVLRAQAQDVRELTRRRLMESGGKREIAMMVPVVFLVLPITVLFAVYPGLTVLDLNL